ncbi:MAG: hypothetical protein KF764_11555 [Labilithrix sp.]|nr:hypothetical protein [Labilithrix sp.]MBX3225404.1 hypothetical protein [Labilithrix sp.]
MISRDARFGFAALLALAPACDDPLRERAVDALGPEVAGVPRGPLHRRGQPCLTCHDGRSEARAFSVAGTVFVTPDAPDPAPGVVVELASADGRTFRVATNCAGNFFVEPTSFAPRYPLFVALESGRYRVEMDTPVQRDGSCASCHREPASRSDVGQVFLYATPRAFDASGCP